MSKYCFRVFDSKEYILLPEIYSTEKEALDFCIKKNFSLGARWAQETDKFQVLKEVI